MKKVILITGASSGFGLITARYFSERGWQVYGTTRDLNRKTEMENVRWVAMDVRSEPSIEAAVAAVLNEVGKIDVLFNNAGIAMLGAIEETSLEETKQIFETNVFGSLRVTRAVLPAMREQKSGTVIMMSSLSGVFGVPFHGIYAASKHSVEAITQSLRLEVEPYGIRVASIEPTAHRTGIHMVTPGRPMSLYDSPRNRVGGIIEGQIRSGPDPVGIAAKVFAIASSSGPVYRYPIGNRAGLLTFLLKILPDSALHFLGKHMFQLRPQAASD